MRTSARSPGSCVLAVLALGSSAHAQPTTSELTFAMESKHAAFRVPGAPAAVVHVPAGFDAAAPLQLVFFLHGFMNCANVVVPQGRASCKPGDAEQEGRGVAAMHDAAGTNSVLVVPQLAFMKRDARAGCFGRGGCFDAFLSELLVALAERLRRARFDPAQVELTIVAHSAGYRTAIAILDRSTAARRVRRVALMDALYAGSERFAYFLRSAARRDPELHMLSIHLGAGGTRSGSKDLLRRGRRMLGATRAVEVRAAEIPAAVARHTLVIALGRGPHRLVPAQHMQEVLRAWLPARTR